MKKFRTLFYFILGWLSIPTILSLTTLFVLDLKKGMTFWNIIYLISYIIFPLLYRNNIPQKFPNKYLFYGIIYLVLSLIFYVAFFIL